MSVLTNLVEPNNLRLALDGGNVVADLVREARADGAFVRTSLRGLASPRARGARPRLDGPVLPPYERWDAPALRGKRVALLASGGSGALASLCGVRRALDEAGVSVSRISACSGANLFASLWALGCSGDEMADFWLSLRTSDYVDPDWRSLARAVPGRFRGWTGLLRGAAIERTFRERFGNVVLGDLALPLSLPVWNVDLNRVEFFGTRETPELSLARAIRVAIAIPIFVQPVPIGGHLYGDGGIVNVFPAEPLVADPAEVVIGVNCYFPEDFLGEDRTGWHDATWSVLHASTQLRSSAHIELARQQARALGERLVLLHPVDYKEIRGAKFYETFLSRDAWPSFIVRGHACTKRAFERADQTRARSSAQAPIGARGDTDATRPPRKNTSDAIARPL